MSLKPVLIQPVPEETARVAQAAFPRGNPYLRLRDELGTIFTDADFADLFPRRGQPGLPPWRLALVTASAVPRGPVRPPGRRGGAGAHRLEIPARPRADRPRLRLLGPVRVPRPPARRRRGGAAARAAAGPLPGAGAAQGARAAAHRLRPTCWPPSARSTASKWSARRCAHALNSARGRGAGLAAGLARRHGSSGTRRRIEIYRLPERGRRARRWRRQSARMAHELLAAVCRARRRRSGCARCPAVETLRQVWVQQFLSTTTRCAGAPDDRPPAGAAACTRPTTPRPGTAPSAGTTLDRLQGAPDRDLRGRPPHLIIDVHTTCAAVSDAAMTGPIHRTLAARGLLPSRHLVDSGYMGSLHESQRCVRQTGTGCGRPVMPPAAMPWS